MNINKIFYNYIYQYVHVSFSASALTILSYIYFDNDINWRIVLLTFFSTFLAYHFIRLINQKTVKSTSVLFSVFGFLGLIYYSLVLSYTQLIILLFISILTIGYVLPIIKLNNWFTLRDVPTLKVVIVALSWSILTTAIPLNKFYNTFDFWMELMQRFLLIVSITIPFDIRDYNTDHTKLKTLPQWVGVENTKKIGVMLMLLYLLLSIITVHSLNYYGILSDIGAFMLVCLWLYYAKPDTDYFYTAFWVEATSIFLLIDVVIWRLIFTNT